MSQTQERRSALDDFAAQASMSKGEVVPVTPYSPPVDMQHGAIAVPVRRDEAKILAKIRVLAAEAGEEWYYRWPVQNRRKGTTEWVEGPSVKCANALLMLYGNCRAYVPRITDLGTHWNFTAVFIDFESGAELGRDFRQRKSGGTMGDDADRKADIAFQIGESKAIRNVVLNALQAYSDFALREAMGSLVDKIGKSIEKYRRQLAERARERGVELARIEAVVGRPLAEWIATDMAKVIAMMTAVHDGMATLDETFPPLKKEEPVDDQLNKFASSASEASHVEGAEAGAAPPPSPPPGAAPATDADAQLGVLLDDTIDTVLRIASRFSSSVQERLENLDLYLVPEPLMYYPDFVKALMKTAVRVAKEDLSLEEAKKYIGSLPVRRKG